MNEVTAAEPDEGNEDAANEAQAQICGSKIDEFNRNLLNAVLRTIPASADEEAQSGRLVAAFAAMSAFSARNEVEGMIAAQAVALHSASMECFRRALLPQQAPEATSKLRKDGANLARAMVDMVTALDRQRGKGQQKVVVEHVHVYKGGQAIVGNVEPQTRVLPHDISSEAEAEGLVDLEHLPGVAEKLSR